LIEVDPPRRIPLDVATVNEVQLTVALPFACSHSSPTREMHLPLKRSSKHLSTVSRVSIIAAPMKIVFIRWWAEC
jgi:hypothetical protein